MSPFASKPTKEEAIKNQNDVALILSDHLFSTKAKHSNTVFSPASITAALTLAASGPGGSLIAGDILSFLRSSSIDELNSVFAEMVSVVFADRSANDGPKISSINGVWIEQSLAIDSLAFKDLFENIFKASFDLVNYRSKFEEVRVELNAWASNHTNGLIKDLLPLSVPFMSSYEKQDIEAYDGFKVLRIPYRQGGKDTKHNFSYRHRFRDDTERDGFSMYFYLPDKKDGLDGLVKTMASTSGFLDDHVPFSKQPVTCVEIDEEGTEAAAATYMRSNGKGGVPRYVDFVADHPFLFLIREDKSGTVLFVGQIFDPSIKSS
ncbi:unnamed protein product, partial [Thlaspi arvense]